MWWHMTLIPGFRGQSQVISEVQGQPDLQSEFQNSQGCYIEKTCLGKKKERKKNKDRERERKRKYEKKAILF